MATKGPLGDGKSGAATNTDARPSTATQIGSARPQQQGSQRAPQSVAHGGPTLKLDPATLRGGLVADPNRPPFKLNGSQSKLAPLVDDDMAPAGSAPSDYGDANDDDPESESEAT